MPLLNLAVAAVLTLPAPQGPGGLTANVNDPSSHGAVGDALLSLDEAIRLANGALLPSQLSPAEQARIAGTGATVSTIRVDPSVVPTIALQSPLTGVVGAGGAAGRLTIDGAGPAGQPPAVIQGGNASHVFALRTHEVTVTGFRIQNGQIAFDVAMPELPGPDVLARIERCELDGQTTCGVKLHATGTEESMLLTTDCTLGNMPVGFVVDDQAVGGRIVGECELITMDGVALGCDFTESGAGSLSTWMLFRSTFTNGQTLARKRRSPTSTQAVMVRFVHSKATCTGDVIDIEGATNGLTMIHHHTSDFVAGAGRKAFWVHPRTALFDVHGSEMRFVGDVAVAGNPFTMRVWQQNNVYENGAVVYDVDGALPNLLWNRYSNCSFTVPATAMSPVVVRQSELTGTTVDGRSPFAPITLDGCYRTGGGLLGSASETNQAPSVFLGSTVIAPLDPQIGASVDLACDLPFGVGLVWIFAFAYPRPTTTIEPVRFYGDPTTAIVLPGMVLFRTTSSIPLPNNAALASVELYVQGVSVPLLSQGWVPDYHLPRGELVRPRL